MNKELFLEVKSLEEAGSFSGYAAVFGNVDRSGDIIKQGAFKASLSRKRKSLPVLWSHNQSDVIGKLTEVKEDSHGLFVKGQLNLKVAKALEVYELMKAGDVNGMSIGYRVKEASRDNKANVLTEIELFEASIVSIPANELAEVVSVKSADSDVEVELKSVKDALSTITQQLTEFKSAIEQIQSVMVETKINIERKESIKAYSEMLNKLFE